MPDSARVMASRPISAPATPTALPSTMIGAVSEVISVEVPFTS